jgi:hypothetical protein
MKLGTHMPDGEMRTPIDIEVCRSKALSIHIEVCRTKVKITTSKNITIFFRLFSFPHDILRTKCQI